MSPHRLPRLLALSSSRADIGRWQPIARAMGAAGQPFSLVLCGYHYQAPADVAELRAGGLPIAEELPPGDPFAAPEGIAAELLARLPALLARQAPDYLCLLGDRHELLAAATAAFYRRLPIVHIGGGYQTLGAWDDVVRHTVSRLATWHLPANEEAAKLLRRHGHDQDHIQIIGAPDLDLVRETPWLSRELLLSELGLPAGAHFLLVTIHPETQGGIPPAGLADVFAVLQAEPRHLVLTAPADEPGAEAIQAAIRELAATRPGVVYRHNLGAFRYVNALRQADAVLGNSSSGVLEAGIVGCPVANLGRRQCGRQPHARQTDLPWEGEALARFLRAGADNRPSPTEGFTSPYGDGCAAARFVTFYRQRLARP